MARTRTTAELEANRTLQRAVIEFQALGIRWDNYHIDVELVASLVFQLGVQRVCLRVGERQYAGVLDGDGGIIGVEKDDHPHRQRFSMAHETGHWVLHRGTASTVGPYCCSDLDMEIGRKNTPPVTDTRSMHKRMEWEANVFAASLLMPESAVIPMFRSTGGSIRKLARQFNVSEQAMEIRLQHLDLPFSYRP